MAEKEKTYPQFISVISNEEYRDLIASNTENECKASEYMSKYWQAQSDKKKLEEELAKTKADYEKLVALVTSSTEAKAMLEAYLAKNVPEPSGEIQSASKP